MSLFIGFSQSLFNSCNRLSLSLFRAVRTMSGQQLVEGRMTPAADAPTLMFRCRSSQPCRCRWPTLRLMPASEMWHRSASLTSDRGWNLTGIRAVPKSASLSNVT